MNLLGSGDDVLMGMGPFLLPLRKKGAAKRTSEGARRRLERAPVGGLHVPQGEGYSTSASSAALTSAMARGQPSKPPVAKVRTRG